MWLLTVRCLLNGDEFDIEDQRGVWRDHAAARALSAVPEASRDEQAAMPADFHAGNALLPALNDLSRAEAEVKWPPSRTRAIKGLAVGQVTDVIHHRLTPSLRGVARANQQILGFQCRDGAGSHGREFRQGVAESDGWGGRSLLGQQQCDSSGDHD